MDILTKQRAAVWTIIVLVILNICALGTVWYQQFRERRLGPTPRREERAINVARFLQRELGLTKQQEEEVKNIQERFFSRAHDLQREIDEFRKESLEELLASEPDERKVDTLAGEIGAREKEKEKLLFDHFLDIKMVCNADQKKKFDLLLHDLLEMMAPPDRRGRHGPPGSRGFQGPPDRGPH